MCDFLWKLELCPQADFLPFTFIVVGASIPSMFNDTRWEMRSYPRLFHARKAEELGISRYNLLHTGRYPVVLPGIRMDRENFDSFRTPRWAEQSWELEALRLRAAQLKFPRIVATHATAARIYGWPLPQHLMTDQLHVCAEDLNSRIRIPRVTLHRTRHFSRWEWLDLPILDPASVFIGLGPDLSLHNLVKLGDAAVGNWHGPPQADINGLRRQIDGRQRVLNRGRLLEALELVRPTIDSPAETNLRLWLRSVGLPEPTVHPQIESDLIKRTIEPDLGYPDKKLALEYEGDHHRDSPDQWARDIERDEAMRVAGWTVLKVTGRTNYRQLEAKIRHHLGLS